jgi:hypothetical protein
VVRVPAGVTVDPTWHVKRDAKTREARAAEAAEHVAKVAALIKEGKCPHCSGSGKVG